MIRFQLAKGTNTAKNLERSKMAIKSDLRSSLAYFNEKSSSRSFNMVKAPIKPQHICKACLGFCSYLIKKSSVIRQRFVRLSSAKHILKIS